MNKEVYNLSSVISKNNTHVKIFQDLMMRHYDDENNLFNKYLSLLFTVKSLRPSYVAPAYHLKRYTELQTSYFIKETNMVGDDNINTITNHVFIQVEFHSTLYSIKMLLDRMVKMFTSYYKGISPNSTFGRINPNGKGSGFMSVVVEKHKDDKFLFYILNEYNHWIKDAVMPRDVITHHCDLPIAYRMEKYVPGELFPKFSPVHFIHTQNDDGGKPELTMEVTDLRQYVDSLYNFFEHTMLWFSNDVLSNSQKQ